MTKTNNEEETTAIKISLNCDLTFSKVIAYTEKMELIWSITFVSRPHHVDTTFEFGQTHILDLSHIDSPVQEILITANHNIPFTLKGLRLGGLPN